MKKILIATTALVATAGVAAAEVSLSGSARVGLQYNDTTTPAVAPIGNPAAIAAATATVTADTITRDGFIPAVTAAQAVVDGAVGGATTAQIATLTAAQAALDAAQTALDASTAALDAIDGTAASTNATSTTLHTRVRLVFAATGETDGGLTWGARARIQTQNGSTATAINSSRVWIGGSWGTLTMGDTDPAGDDFGIASFGFANVGGAEAAEASRYTGGANVRYDGEFGNLAVVATVGLSYSREQDHSGDFSLGFAYDFGNFNVAMAYDHDDAFAAVAGSTWAGGNNNSVSAKVSGTFGDVTVGLLVADSDAYGSGWGIDAAYKMGNLTIGANYSEIDDDNGLIGGAGDNDSYEIGFKYGLGGGATLAGGIGQNTLGGTVADFGLNLSF